jgi:hypothetical protein
MNLSTFPHAIATAQTKLVKITNDLNNVRRSLSAQELEIDKAIAFSTDFKNDSQRKAAKVQMLQESARYQELTTLFDSINEKYQLADIDLQLVKNNFAIGKLEARERIADKESLVG